MCAVAFCSGEAEQIEWSKIQTPTDEVVVPYDILASPTEGMIVRPDLILLSKCSVVVVVSGSIRESSVLFVNADWIVCLWGRSRGDEEAAGQARCAQAQRRARDDHGLHWAQVSAPPSSPLLLG